MTTDFETHDIGTADKLKRYQEALVAIRANTAPKAVSLSPKNRIRAIYRIADDVLKNDAE